MPLRAVRNHSRGFSTICVLPLQKSCSWPPLRVRGSCTRRRKGSSSTARPAAAQAEAVPDLRSLGPWAHGSRVRSMGDSSSCQTVSPTCDNWILQLVLLFVVQFDQDVDTDALLASLTQWRRVSRSTAGRAPRSHGNDKLGVYPAQHHSDNSTQDGTTLQRLVRDIALLDSDSALLSDLGCAAAMPIPRCVVSRFATSWAESLEGAMNGHAAWAVLCR